MVWITLANSLLSIVAVLLIFRLLDEAGFFRVIAQSIAISGKGEGRKLFRGIVFLVGITAVLFNNYISILLWTPVLMETLQILRFRPKPTLAYVLTISLVAETGSLICLTSNPLNWMTTQFWDISILHYTLVMLPITVILLVTLVIILRFYFDRYLPLRYRLTPFQETPIQINDPLLCRWGVGIISLLSMASVLPQFSGLITGITALITLAIGGRWFGSDKISPWSKSQNTRSDKIFLIKAIQQIPWYAVIFTVVMSGLGLGLEKVGFLPGLTTMFSTISDWGLTLATLIMGFWAMVSSLIFHHFPMVINNNLGLESGKIENATVQEAMIYANLMGCSLGAKIMPMGSLSSLLWLDIVQRQGLMINWQQYIRFYLVLVVPTLVIGLLSLALWIPWIVP